MIDPAKNNKSEESISNNSASPKLEQGLFGRFVDRIKNTFAPTANMQNPISLKGRVFENDKHSISHQSHTHTYTQIENLNERLEAVGQKFDDHLDQELIGYVKEAMELITRDYRRLQKRAAQAIDDGKACHIWMAKAKHWVGLDTKLHNRTAVIDALIKNYFVDLEARIEQDLQVILDYKKNVIADLALSMEEKNQLTKTLKEQLLPYLQGLIQLKETPSELELHKIKKWEIKVNENRTVLFEKALNLIEEMKSSFDSIEIDVEKQSDHLVAIDTAISSLQENTSQLLQQAISVAFVSDEVMKKSLKASLLPLQHQAHELNGNLHLTSEQFELLQGIQNDLVEVEALL